MPTIDKSFLRDKITDYLGDANLAQTLRTLIDKMVTLDLDGEEITGNKDISGHVTVLTGGRLSFAQAGAGPEATSINIPDEGVHTVTPDQDTGVLMVTHDGGAEGTTGGASATLHFDVANGNRMGIATGTNVTLTSGDLTGTTGSAGDLTISVRSNGDIEIENQLGTGDVDLKVSCAQL